jgi:hypothetical protein
MKKTKIDKSEKNLKLPPEKPNKSKKRVPFMPQ